jgi:hypothetical protein
MKRKTVRFFNPFFRGFQDDNKVLTLASNERIALTPEMRLLFEISNLRTATPATVSRAGICKFQKV